MAEYHAWVVFGDAMQALLYDEKPAYLNRHNVKVQPLLLVPSQEVIERYNLTDDDLNIQTDDGKRARWIEYPIKQIYWMNRSMMFAGVLVFCAFDGSKTDLMDYYNQLLEMCVEYDKIEGRLRAHIATLQQELEDLTSNQAELLKNVKQLQELAGTRPGMEDDVDEGGGS